VAVEGVFAAASASAASVFTAAAALAVGMVGVKDALLLFYIHPFSSFSSCFFTLCQVEVDTMKLSKVSECVSFESVARVIGHTTV
jgi:hypothetical protein